MRCGHKRLDLHFKKSFMFVQSDCKWGGWVARCCLHFSQLLLWVQVLVLAGHILFSSKSPALTVACSSPSEIFWNQYDFEHLLFSLFLLFCSLPRFSLVTVEKKHFHASQLNQSCPFTGLKHCKGSACLTKAIN